MSSERSFNGEHTLLHLKAHWMQYGMPLFLTAVSWLLYLICSALSTALMNWSHTASLIALVGGHVLLLLFHHAAFYQILSASTARFLLTNKRILRSQGHLWL